MSKPHNHVVDCVQRVRVRDKYPTRQMELHRVSERMLETARSLALPLILGVQLARTPVHLEKVRLDDLIIEAGDIEQDAHLVLGLFNPAMEAAQDEAAPVTDVVTALEVTVLKNRNGPVNGEVLLDFDRALLTLREPEDDAIV